MHYAILTSLLTLFSSLHVTAGLGVNCRGSSQCSLVFNSVGTTNLIENFNESLWMGNNPLLPYGPINDDAIYHWGEHIMCARNSHLAQGSICLFLQGEGGAGASGNIIKKSIRKLAEHGCHICGSVPLASVNDVDLLGELTSNYVLSKSCQGLCSPGELPSSSQPLPPSLSLLIAASMNQTMPATMTTLPNPAEAGPTVDPQQRNHPGFGGNTRPKP